MRTSVALILFCTKPPRLFLLLLLRVIFIRSWSALLRSHAEIKIMKNRSERRRIRRRVMNRSERRAHGGEEDGAASPLQRAAHAEIGARRYSQVREWREASSLRRRRTEHRLLRTRSGVLFRLERGTTLREADWRRWRWDLRKIGDWRTRLRSDWSARHRRARRTR